VFDPDALAGALEQLSPAYAGVATIALDHPRVRAAIDDLADRDVAVVTLVSDAPSSRRLHYVGTDNPAAGRTAATLMGRFLSGRKGAVGVIAGSLSLRDHAERQFGFHQILSSEYPELVALPVLEGRDDSERTRLLAAELLERHPDLLSIYSAGAGNRGIAAALEAAGRAREVVWIAPAHAAFPGPRHDRPPSSTRIPATKRVPRRASCSRIARPSPSAPIRSVFASTSFCGTICPKMAWASRPQSIMESTRISTYEL
jgi:hypothetical protein